MQSLSYASVILFHHSTLSVVIFFLHFVKRLNDYLMRVQESNETGLCLMLYTTINFALLNRSTLSFYLEKLKFSNTIDAGEEFAAYKPHQLQLPLQLLNYKYDRRTLLQLQPLLQNLFLEPSFFLVEAALSKSVSDNGF